MPRERHLSGDEPLRWSFKSMTDEATKTFEKKISKLGDDISSLSLKEAVDLADYMKVT